MSLNSITTNSSDTILSKLKSIKISGISLPLYTIIAILILFTAKHEILPANMVGALAIMMVLGSLFATIGSNTPIVKSYLGGGAVFCIFASSALATFNVLPQSVIDNCTDFMNNVGFLDFYIAALICGSILGMDRNLLKKAAIRFLPISFLSMACAALVGGLVGMVCGNGFKETILYIAMPMMSGGMGAGVVPLSGIYADALNVDKSAVVSLMVPASTIGNVLAIIAAALIARLGESIPSINGHGKLMELDQKNTKENRAIDYISMGVGLLMAMSFFTLGCLINKLFPSVHAYAFMIILVVICKIIGVIPENYEYCAVSWSQFVMKNLTNALLAGIGISMLNLKTLANAITPIYLLICVSIIVTVALVSGLLGKLVGFYPVESSITAGLCTNSMGGTGNIAVLSAANRMGLIPFAQMATRLGGAVILIVASILVRIL